MTTKNYIFPLLMVSFLFSCQAQESKNMTEEAFDSALQEIFNNSGLPGYSITIVDKEKTIYEKSLGYADIENKIPFSSTTTLKIGSVSKTIVAMALMKAQEMGHLHLDDPIEKHLPFHVKNPHHPDVPITIRHLSHHSSGINDGDVYMKSYVLDNDYKIQQDLPGEIKAYLNIMKKNEKITYNQFLYNVLSPEGIWYSKGNFLNKKPGEEQAYSNIGAALAALIVEHATGTSFYSFTEKHIFEPLGMHVTAWKKNEKNAPHFASRYLPGKFLLPDYDLITSPDGGLITNCNDFGKYLIETLNGALGNGKILNKKSYDEMYSKNNESHKEGAIFWAITDTGVITHSGGDPGITTIAAVKPSIGQAVFIMTNISADEDENLSISLGKIWDFIKSKYWK